MSEVWDVAGEDIRDYPHYVATLQHKDDVILILTSRHEIRFRESIRKSTTNSMLI